VKMLTAAGWSIILLAALAGHAGVAAAATQEHIGSWVISCPDDAAKSGACLMRSSKRFLDKAGVTGDLEVRAQERILVPVIVFRGVSAKMLIAASLIGKTEASIRLQSGASTELHCAASSADDDSAVDYVCAPNEADGEKLGEGLPGARAASVRVAIAAAALKPLPVLEKSLEMSGTNEALVRLRTLGPKQVPSSATAMALKSSSALVGMAHQALKAAGYPNGLAELQSLLAKYGK
jgi:hypothetical protein